MAKISHGEVDRFKLIAAILVIAIHTGPFISYSPSADFILTGIVARLAVPFFFMASGYFFFGRMKGEKAQERAALKRFMLRIGLLYGAGFLMYLPLNVYAGHFNEPWSIASLAKDIVFDGTFYHLWYLPALMTGTCIVYWLRAKTTDRYVLVVASVLYVFALLGDSYYGLAAQIGFLSSFYDHLFEWFDYTRGGIGFAPLYIALGASAANRDEKSRSGNWYAAAFLVSMGLLLAEGIVLHEAGYPRHDSMYIALVPAVYALFRLLLTWGGRERRFMRQASTWVYMLHPLAIVLIRGIAKLTGLEPVLVKDSLVHFLAVTALSMLLSSAVVFLAGIRRTKVANKIPGTDRAWAEINLEHLDHNLRELKNALPPSTQIMAVVKAEAYGHGSIRIAKRLYRAGVRCFAVAEIDEGIKLRRKGVRGEILILGYTPTHRLGDVVRFRLTQTAVSANDAERLQAFGKKIKVHIKIDTGMNRLGEPYDDTERVLSMYRHSRLKVTGTFSHLAAADSLEQEDVAFTRMQIERFESIVRQVRAVGFRPGMVHLQSSYGILNYSELNLDVARPGIALYGLLSSECDRIRADVDLRPVLTLKARVTRVNGVRAGESVGYGRSFTAPLDCKVATVSIGYADGIPRELPERGGCVLIHGQRARIVGKMCMDQMMVDVTDINDVRQGDPVTLIGQDGENRITAGEIAEMAGTITNEVVSALGARVSRIFI
ncbi:serine racemase VanT catalytic subunit [Paenibacillus beijingensis]|uniref:Alanine racemase n=1 Tax=Paenibacillus beijingensis TaxID=1126833 RepID=A0A0D5NF13_9BACL|nr:serine racemase VanT catalytic subunit [Paenibacillus beijingensis]AJY73508.1 amino acid racemase [Paenibacillus beijingensis]